MTEQIAELRKASSAIYLACHEDVAKDVSRILKGAADEIERLRAGLRSASTQCGNVIFNCEQRPANNDRHLSSWRGVRDFIDAALTTPEGRGE